MKIVVVLLVVGLVLWFALRRGGRPTVKPRAKQPRLQSMVRCAHCGVHLPQDEAVAGDELFYCSEAHRALGQRDEHHGR
ncbi:MAG: PP0621 family protein [Pseudomonadota bacterium]